MTGCTKISPGCKHCYAETFAERWRGIPGHPYKQGFDLRLWPDRIDMPLTWKRPRTIFVNSMSDLFHEKVPLPFIQRVFETMEKACWHTFQILTKRSKRLADLAPDLNWPPNVWMGVSIETAKYLWRVDHLRQVAAAVKFLSLEPLLGPLSTIDLSGIPSCAKTRPFRNRPQISSLDALGIRAESRVFRAAGLTSDPWGWRMNK